MKIIHQLDEEYFKDTDDKRLSIFMLSKTGHYFSANANPRLHISNYAGWLHQEKETLFKSLEGIHIEDDSGTCVPFAVKNSFVSSERQYDEMIVNLVEFVGIKTVEDALDYMAKRIGITQSKEVRIERMKEILDKYLLPNLGTDEGDRIFKAYNICKFLKRYIEVMNGRQDTDDKDHYKNKRLKLAGDLLADLLRLNLKVLIGDLLYNFQRIVKRGKFPSIKVIIRDKLLTQRIYSSMATGSWVGGRKGISQRIQRLNYLETLSHLQRVVSPLSASQENFQARELHPTHLGRLCPIETPEGTNIGLRKNLALLCSISPETSEEDVLKALKQHGLKPIKEK